MSSTVFLKRTPKTGIERDARGELEVILIMTTPKNQIRAILNGFSQKSVRYFFGNPKIAVQVQGSSLTHDSAPNGQHGDGIEKTLSYLLYAKGIAKQSISRSK